MPAPKREHLIQEAEKLAARGKLDAAVREYQRALEQAPHDTTTLNRLGDLLVKADRTSEAIDVYRRIGEHFAEDGFFLKAIAIYKKVNRFDPQRTDIYERLADLYYKQGLAVEGRQQLVTLAEWFARSHNVDEAMRVYRRLAELEPTNLQVRAKLVDALIQRGDVTAVTAEIDGLGQSLLSRGMLDEALKLYHRAVELEPENVEFIARCVDALVEHDRAKQAVELAERAIAAGTPGLDLTRAAALAYSAMGDQQHARELLERQLPGGHDRVEFAQAYADVLLKIGDVDGAKRAVLPLVDGLISTRDSRRAVQLVRRMLKASPGDLDVLERAMRVFNRRDEPELVATIEASLADVYFRTGRAAEALPIYRRLVEDNPDNALFAERLASLTPGRVAPTAASGPIPTGTAPPIPKVATPPTPPPLQIDSQPEFVEIDMGEALPTEEETVISFTTPAEEPKPEPDRPHAAEVARPASPETAADELYTEAVVFAKYGLTDKATAHLQRLLEIQPSHADALELLASLTGQPPLEELLVPPELPLVLPELPVAGVAPVVETEGQEQLPPPGAPIEAAVVGEAALPSRPEPEQATSEAPPEVPTARPKRPQRTPPVEIPLPAPPPLRRPGISGAIRVEDLEAALGITRTASVRHERKPLPAPVEFDASSLLSTPAEVRPSPPPVEWVTPIGAASAEPAPEAGGGAVSSPAPEDGAAVGFQEPIEVLQEAAEVVDVADLLGGPEEEKLREADFLVEQGLLDDAAHALAELRESFPDHPEVVRRQAGLKARGWDEAAAPPPPAAADAGTAEELFSEEEQFFDLAAELERELADEELVAEATGSAQGGEVSIEELFKEFQRGVAEQVSAQDFDTHFNLGLAYREMGLHDEAIGEFQLASKSAAYFIECASMIGACYMEKGLPEQAAEWYDRALKAPDLPPEAELGLRYELGRTQEAAGNAGAALAYYAEVLAINPAFRDVVDRVSRLQAN